MWGIMFERVTKWVEGSWGGSYIKSEARGETQGASGKKTISMHEENDVGDTWRTKEESGYDAYGRGRLSRHLLTTAVVFSTPIHSHCRSSLLSHRCHHHGSNKPAYTNHPVVLLSLAVNATLISRSKPTTTYYFLHSPLWLTYKNEFGRHCYRVIYEYVARDM